jgi:hypothetical protein
MTSARMLTLLLMLVSLALPACHGGPPPAETPDQQRFMTGCRPADAARDPTAFTAYCDRF